MFELVGSKSGNGRVRDLAAPDGGRLRRAAWAFTARRVPKSICVLADKAAAPKAGDLVLARVDTVGYHAALQLPDGRRRQLFVGDEIVVVFGNRYAPNQFEAVVPETLGPCELVAAGGVAGRVLSWHAAVKTGATQITPIGLLAGPDGEPANVRDHALPPADHVPAPRPSTVAVVGTAMDSGKTQTAAYLVKGLTHAGLRAGYAKVTGTGAGNDTWLLKDAGANPVLDFTDAGMVSTYLASPAEVQGAFVTLMAHLVRSRVDAIVLEVADGVLQGETQTLLASAMFQEVVGGILFTACDAMGAVAGRAWLLGMKLPLVGLSGVLTASPLQKAEASKATGLPVYLRQDLAQPQTATRILTMAERQQPEAVPARSGAKAARGPGRVVAPASNASEPSREGLTSSVEARR